MYRRPKFLEKLLEVRREMARTADYDVDRFAEMIRSGSHVPVLPPSDEPAESSASKVSTLLDSIKG